ncbi:10266_t:CDS:1 [Racocetra persica]|uniref:10266_t:CDS:1 n=1 Tax=Racocetra persica TaxID=160502 RepID=A0ACA9L5P7_9GLOM|nr:10266_t:CDS:1 [Racocetra persica]
MSKSPEMKIDNELLDDYLKWVLSPCVFSPRFGVDVDKTYIIGAFNIQKFSGEKFKNDAVMRNIVKIIKRYDIIFCQKVSMSNRQADLLMNKLNGRYSHALSPSVGKTSGSKE